MEAMRDQAVMANITMCFESTTFFLYRIFSAAIGFIGQGHLLCNAILTCYGY